MKTPDDRDPDNAHAPEGELMLLELQVARRADSLWRDSGSARGSDLVHWLQAEDEILGRHRADNHLAGTMAEAR